MANLALNGGPKTITQAFTPYNSIGAEEVAAGLEVLQSGKLSGFFGSWNDRFYGGEKVRAFEEAWAKYFGVEYAISFNSLTTGLVAAVGALGIEPGDEVIVSPWTMCATASAVLAWNAIPVFADIEADTFNLDPVSVAKNITPLTKAIIVTNIFGHPAKLDEILAIAKEHNLKVIEDNAQSPNAVYKNKLAGTIGDIGGFSLNYHKHIHTGEGGVMVTNDEKLADKMRLIRNHGEAVVEKKGETDIINIIGYNFRLGEIEAAIGLEQLKKLPQLTKQKTEAGTALSQSLKDLPGLLVPPVTVDCSHVYYIYAMRLQADLAGVGREKIIAALQAEGIPWVYGGYQLLHLLPTYQQKIAYGSHGFPWTGGLYHGQVDYSRGICPVAEKLNDEEVICLQMGQHYYTKSETDLVISAFKKVWANINELK